MNYPVIKKTKNNVVNKSKKSMIVPSQGAITIPNIFNQTQNNYALRDGRVNCTSVVRTAIYTDANGNRIVLKENATTMNTDKNGPGLRFRSGNKEFKKKRY